MSKKFVKILNFSSFLIILFIIFMLIKLLGKYYIFCDDVVLPIYPDIKCMLMYPCSSDYISTCLDSFLGLYLPIKMHIHPADFKSIYFAYIEVCLILLYPLILLKIFIFNLLKRFKVFFVYIFLFIFLSFLCLMSKFEGFFYIYETLFRMFMPILYWLGLFYLLLKNNKSHKDYVIMNIMGFMCCFSNEMIAVSAIVGCICYFIFQVIKKKTEEKKSLIILFIFMIFGLIIYINAGAFLRRAPSTDVININYFLSVMNEIPEFSICYLKEVFINHIGFYIAIAFCLCSLYIKLPKNEEKDRIVFLALSFLFGILVFFYLLVFMKKSHYIPNQYWLIHWDLHYIFNIMLFGIILCLVSLIIKYRKIQLNKVIATIFIFVLVLSNIDFISYKKLYTRMKEKKENMYKLEKTIRLACLKNKTAVIENNIDIYNTWWIMPIDKSSHKKTNIYDIGIMGPIQLLNRYSPRHRLIGTFVLGNSKEVEDAFKENGGYYTEKELKELKFTNLLDDKFVLGMNNPE